MSPAANQPSDPKAPVLKINVLKCRGEACNGLLAYEETNEGFLLGQVFLLAAEVDGKRFLPCPECGGRNLVQEKDIAGKMRTCVIGFEAV